MRIASVLAAGAALVALAATPALAQDYNQNPTYGGIALTAGFTPDPSTTQVVAGGRTPASNVGSCAGWVATAPDYRLNYTAGSYALTIIATADQDSTLLVNAPDGSWHCDDDSAGNFNPAITFASPQSGQYDIWVGTYASGSLQPSSLSVSELYSE